MKIYRVTLYENLRTFRHYVMAFNVQEAKTIALEDFPLAEIVDIKESEL